MASVLGVSEATAAGAVICGAYFGDKMTPLSETTILVPRLVGGLTTGEHIRNMFWTSGPALAFPAIVEHAGFLERLLQPVVTWARSRGGLILAVNSSAIGLNVTAGDQYVDDVLPARMFRDEFRRRGLAPQVLSRAVEDSGTVTSPLLPCVLGVSTAAYLPDCFFNLLRPVLDVLYGFLGFKVQTIDPAGTAVEAADGTSTPAHPAPK